MRRIHCECNYAGYQGYARTEKDSNQCSGIGGVVNHLSGGGDYRVQLL